MHTSHIQPQHYPTAQHLYHQSFPADERRPWEELIHATQTNQEHTLVTTDNQHNTLALAHLTPLKTIKTTLLSYLAVHINHRGKQLGSHILTAAIQETKNHHHTHLLIEIEPPTAPPHPWHGDPRRRLHFYQNHQAEIITQHYGMPNLENPDHPTVPLLLLAIPTSTGHTPNPHTWIQALWGPENYNTHPNNPQLALLLQQNPPAHP